MACSHCGAWSITGDSAKLRAQCAPPTAAGAHSLKRLGKKLFPKGEQYKGTVLTDLLPIDPALMPRNA